MNELLRGLYDMHIHTAPDVVARKCSDLEAAQRMLAAGMRGGAIKSHYLDTAGRAQLLKEQFPTLHIVGGITLNRSVGGLNPCAAERSAQAGGKMLNDQGEIDIDNEAGLKTVEFLKSLLDAGIFTEDIVTESESVDKFAAGEVAFIVADLNKGNSAFTPAGIDWEYVFSLKGPAGYGARTATDSFAVNKKTVARGNDELAV